MGFGGIHHKKPRVCSIMSGATRDLSTSGGLGAGLGSSSRSKRGHNDDSVVVEGLELSNFHVQTALPQDPPY